MDFYSSYEHVAKYYQLLMFLTTQRNFYYYNPEYKDKDKYNHYSYIIDIVCSDFMKLSFSFINKFSNIKCHLSTGEMCVITSFRYDIDYITVIISSTDAEKEVHYKELRLR